MKIKGKAWIKLVTIKSNVRMGFTTRLIYSFLLRCQFGISKARLAKLTGTHASRTLPAILTKLLEDKLIRKEGVRYYAVPWADVVTWNEKPKYYDRVAYLAYYLPSPECPLTKKQLAVYYCMLNGKRGTSRIAKLLQVANPTVINAIRVLKHHGLVDQVGDVIDPKPEDKLTWWKDKITITRNTEESTLTHLADVFSPLLTALDNLNYPILWKLHFNGFGKQCYKSGYGFDPVKKLIVDACRKLGNKPKPIAKVLQHLCADQKKAEVQSKTNRRMGRFSGSSSFGLFKIKLYDRIKAENNTN